MFFGMMLVDAALAAWAVGLMQQKGAPRWVVGILVWLGVTLVASMGLVLLAVDSPGAGVSEKHAALIGPTGAGIALVALLAATVSQRRATKQP